MNENTTKGEKTMDRERIAKLRENLDHWCMLTDEEGAEVLDALEAALARAEGAEAQAAAQAGGVVLPDEVPEAALDFIADDPRFIWDPWSEEHDTAVRLYHEWLARHLPPASHVLGDVEALRRFAERCAQRDHQPDEHIGGAKCIACEAEDALRAAKGGA